jgi:hypothetical protein
VSLVFGAQSMADQGFKTQAAFDVFLENGNTFGVSNQP